MTRVAVAEAMRPPRGDLMAVRTIIEPFKIRSVEPLRWTTRHEREELLRQVLRIFW